MNVRFGNLSVMGFAEKTEVELSDEDFIWLNEHRTNSANFTEDNMFHIFDLPMGMVAGSDIGEELIERLRKYNFKRHFYVETKESEKDPDFSE